MSADMTDLAPLTTSRALAAQAWLDVREPLDRQLSPLGLQAMDALRLLSGETVVDVGCGAGQTLLQLAERVGADGRIVGVDISAPLLDAARSQASGDSRITCVESDATDLGLPSRSVDAFFSRFGVMALPDHAAAFANFHRMLKPDGRIAFVCWRSLVENELDLLPLRAARLEHLVDPTPFSFEDPGYARDVLERAGFKTVSIRAHDEAVSCGDLEATSAVLLKVGALGRILRENPALRAEAEPRVRAALMALGDPATVALKAATWIVTAQA
jgi:SAM-dependent methyltransferase